MVGGGFTDSASGGACITSCPVSAKLEISADCDEQGKHDVDITFRVDSTPGTYQAVVTVGSVRNVAPLSSADTRTITTQITDGQPLTVAWQSLDQAGRVAYTKTLYRSSL